MSLSSTRRLYAILTTIAVILIVAFYLFPYWWVIITSFRTQDEERALPWVLYPNPVRLDNYEKIFFENAFDVLTGLKNTLIVSAITTVICVVLGSLAGYAYARIPFRGRGLSIALMLATWTIPWLLVMIPLWAILYDLQLIDTKLGLIIGFVSGFVPITTWIMLSHFRSLPVELEDAARCDGCSRLGTLFRIVLPISTPAIMAAGAFAFISSMGEFLFSLIVTTSSESRTLPVVLAALVGKYVTEKTIMAAGTVIAAIFPLVLVTIFQRYLIAGLSAGAVKG
jgi:multiple sugar transport system permease protein